MNFRTLRGTPARLSAGLCAIAALAAPASAQTLQLTQSNATVLRGGSYANTNFSSDGLLVTRASSDATYVRRIVVKFDTHNSILANASIASAALTLTVAGGNAESRRIAASRIATSYDSAQASWNRRYSGTTWSAAGGDLAEQHGTATVTASVGSQVTFDVTSLVQGVVNGTFGSSRYTRIALVDTGGSSIDSYREYYSDEAADVTVRPTLTVTIGSGTVAPPAPAPTSTILKVLEWNIHHGVGTDGKYDIPRFVTWMAKWRPDVVSIIEAEKFTSWGNEDQPKRFRDLLQSATGQPWYYHFAQEYGNWDANGKGNLLLSRFPFVATGRETLSWSRTMGIATIVVNGRNINVMSTHLDPESRDRREEQARQVVSIASSWSHPRIITGDFNAWPDQSSIKVMTAAYVDSWAKAEASGAASSFAGNSPFGATKNGRIDYIFHSPGSTVLFLQRVQVPDTRDSSGIMPSDHRPVISTYEVR